MIGVAASLAAPCIAGNSALAATPIVRRDVMDMTDSDPFFADYAKAIREMHARSDTRSWLAQAKIHADYCHHEDVEFLHWHRHYIRFFEKICATLSGNAQFALPYWNWSKNSGRIPAPFFDRPELNVEYWKDQGRYDGKAWGRVNTVGVRGLDKTHGLLDDANRGGPFTLDAISAIKQLSTIDDFWPALMGGPHNTAHRRVGAAKSGERGHMGDGLSPLDPIFWLHHCMVDRVWAEWQRANHQTPDPKADYSGQFTEVDGSPAKADSTGAMDIANLDYTYDTLETALLRGGGGAPLQQLSPQQVEAIDQLLKLRPPQAIGSATNTNISRPNVETGISVSVPGLSSQVRDLRALEAAGLTVGSRRVLARLSNVVAPELNDVIVNVFIDCPYLDPTTPYTDPHYGGSFSFFGAEKPMPGMGAPHFVIDITGPVRNAGFDAEKVKVQLMPLPLSADVKSTASFTVSKIDVVSI
jgi:tyrosinase